MEEPDVQGQGGDSSPTPIECPMAVDNLETTPSFAQILSAQVGSTVITKEDIKNYESIPTDLLEEILSPDFLHKQIDQRMYPYTFITLVPPQKEGGPWHWATYIMENRYMGNIHSSLALEGSNYLIPSLAADILGQDITKMAQDFYDERPQVGGWPENDDPDKVIGLMRHCLKIIVNKYDQEHPTLPDNIKNVYAI